MLCLRPIVEVNNKEIMDTVVMIKTCTLYCLALPKISRVVFLEMKQILILIIKLISYKPHKLHRRTLHYTHIGIHRSFQVGKHRRSYMGWLLMDIHSTEN